MIRSRKAPATRTPSKPRASGDDPAVQQIADAIRYVNPARAGMIRTVASISPALTRKPRASGDDPERAWQIGTQLK